MVDRAPSAAVVAPDDGGLRARRLIVGDRIVVDRFSAVVLRTGQFVPRVVGFPVAVLVLCDPDDARLRLVGVGIAADGQVDSAAAVVDAVVEACDDVAAPRSQRDHVVDVEARLHVGARFGHRRGGEERAVHIAAHPQSGRGQVLEDADGRRPARGVGGPVIGAFGSTDVDRQCLRAGRIAVAHGDRHFVRSFFEGFEAVFELRSALSLRAVDLPDVFGVEGVDGVPPFQADRASQRDVIDRLGKFPREGHLLRRQYFYSERDRVLAVVVRGAERHFVVAAFVPPEKVLRRFADRFSVDRPSEARRLAVLDGGSDRQFGVGRDGEPSDGFDERDAGRFERVDPHAQFVLGGAVVIFDAQREVVDAGLVAPEDVGSFAADHLVVARPGEARPFGVGIARGDEQFAPRLHAVAGVGLLLRNGGLQCRGVGLFVPAAGDGEQCGEQGERLSHGGFLFECEGAG